MRDADIGAPAVKSAASKALHETHNKKKAIAGIESRFRSTAFIFIRSFSGAYAFDASLCAEEEIIGECSSKSRCISPRTKSSFRNQTAGRTTHLVNAKT